MPGTASANTTLIGLLVSSTLISMVLVVALILVWKRRQAEVVAVTRNELYGTYDNGVEYSTVEDTNDYYAAS